MYHKYNLPDGEYEVMEMVWQCGNEIRQTELLKKFELAGKGWKRQTLNTLIIRLEEKELLERENRVVKALITRDEYNHLQMKENIDCMYGGKLSSFLAAFTGQEAISKEEKEKILKILEQGKK